MLRSLPSADFECHLVVPGEPPLRSELEAAGVTVHIVPMARISTSHGAAEWARYALGWPVAVGRIARLVRRLDIDVVHTNSLHSWYGWAAAALTRRPHVWHGREIVVQSEAALRVERVLTRHFATLVGAMTRSARLAAAAKPRSWNQRPRRVYVAGKRIGAASCTVTTSLAPLLGGTASDGACTTSKARSRRERWRRSPAPRSFQRS